MSARYPNVPQTPGVPAVFRNDTNPPNETAGQLRGSAAQAAASADMFKNAWGIFDSAGRKALDPDSFAAIEFQRELRISDYPQENGGFRSYNKVAVPFMIRCTVTKSGTIPDRDSFLAKIAAMVNGTDLFTVAQPERTYGNVNFVQYEYKRTGEEGAGMLRVEMVGEEVRITAKGKFSTTKDPSGANQQNGGPVRPLAPTKAQTPPRGPS